MYSSCWHKRLMEYTIILDNMEFFCYHGCREDEKINGNTFTVDLRATYTGSCGESDNLEDAVNYGAVYRTIAAQMQIRSNLLENLAWRIMEALKAEYPALDRIELTVSKKNPPVDGPCAWSRIETRWQKELKK